MSIKVKNLKKEFKSFKKKPGLFESFKSLFHREYITTEAVKDLSFEIEDGELVGFIGSNGAGKTTTMKMLSGLLHPTSGEVSVSGFTPTERKSDFLKSISLVMGQKNQLWSDISAMDGIILNKEIYEIDDKTFRATLDELLPLLDLEDIINQQVRKMSLGQRMKCELVAALIHKPKILFLDEPTIGLDVIMQKKLRAFLKEYNKKYNATILLTSHYMDDVKEICNRVIMIDKGSLLYDGSIDELTSKHANYKILIPTFNEKVETKNLEQFGEIIKSEEFRAEIKVERSRALSAASEILANFPVDDLDINELRLEDIVEEMFSR